MSIGRIRSGGVVRPRRKVVIPWLTCALIFALTTAVVYRVGRERWQPVDTRATFTATAFVAEQPPLAASPTRIPFTETNVDRQHAAERAEALAERYVRTRLAMWRSDMAKACETANEAAKRAREEYGAATTRLTIFQSQLMDTGKASGTQATETAALPSMLDNPRWVELDGRLTKLRAQRDQLLIDRTPLHPAVREVEDRIADVEQQLAGVPRQIEGSTQSARQASRPPQELQEPRSPKEMQRLAELMAAVEQSRQARNEAERTEQQAIASRQAEPKLTIERGSVVAQPAKVDYGWRRLIAIATAGGLLMALGLGLAAVGASIEPAVGGAVELERTIGIPVVAVLPALDPAPATISPARQRQRRRAAITLGLLLMAACPIVAFFGMMGI